MSPTGKNDNHAKEDIKQNVIVRAWFTTRA